MTPKVPSNLSPRIFTETEKIKQMAGNPEEIDNSAEAAKLSELLSTATGAGDVEYLLNLKNEYENKYPTPEKYQEQQAQKELMQGISEQERKQIEKCLKDYDNNTLAIGIQNSEQALALKKLFNEENGFSKEAKIYLAQEMEKRHITTNPEVIERVALSKEEQTKMREGAEMVRKALEGYTDKDEVQKIISFLRNEINEDNIMEFLAGYNLSGLKDNGFFDQLVSENFADKAGLADYVSDKFISHLKKYDGYVDSSIKPLSFFDVVHYGLEDSIMDGFGFSSSGPRTQARMLDKEVFKQVQMKYGHLGDAGVEYKDIKPEE